MTPEEINRILAKRLFGWHLEHGQWWVPTEKPGHRQCVMFEDQWDPYHNITQAMGDGGPGTVVGRMRERQYHMKLVTGELGNKKVWYCEFWIGIEDGENISAPTPSAAICEAAAPALGGKG